MIGLDWGTSSLRAYRLGRDGAVREKREAARGILSVPEGGFPDALLEAVGDWIAAGERRVLLCGMVGSRQGWVEAPYLPCPAGPAEIAAATVPIPWPDATLRLVPGLSTRDAAGVPDVMRGEETKLLALLGLLGDARAVACLPGTHSKWAVLEGGRIAGYATHMTGEAFAALAGHTILARTSTEGPTVPADFARGLARAGQPGGLLHHLFGTRALGLMGELAPAATRSYLSGLLIGHEVAAALAETRAAEVHLVGAEVLAELYATALDAAGVAVRRHDPDLVASGLAAIGRHAFPEDPA
jgi:2-dehydro-3-deoxygalactonokinase